LEKAIPQSFQRLEKRSAKVPMIGKSHPAKFPTIGKTQCKSSNDWKNGQPVFQSLETSNAALTRNAP
jgi:hypothetical protein